MPVRLHPLSWAGCTPPAQVSSPRFRSFARDSTRGAGGGNRTRLNRYGKPACHHDTSPAWVPTLWNRTRTSRAKAERADQLRQRGTSRRAFVAGHARRCRERLPGARHHHCSSVVTQDRDPVIGSRDSGSRITTSQHRIVLRAAPERGPKRRRPPGFLGGPVAAETSVTSSAQGPPSATAGIECQAGHKLVESMTIAPRWHAESGLRFAM